jgi:hypothetical protein
MAARDSPDVTEARKGKIFVGAVPRFVVRARKIW